jgi:AraC-like DNA-binding protein
VDTPGLADPLLRHRVHQVHRALALPGEELEAESRLALVCERLRGHLLRERGQQQPASAPPPERSLAGELRELLDACTVEGVTLQHAGERLHAHPAHLVRAFSREFGIAPHSYLTSRRVDLARRLLLDGVPPGTAATDAGFYDQAHLGRHFRRIVGTSPGRFRR